MTTDVPGVSPAFQSFLDGARGHAEPWMAMVRALERASVLDRRTGELAYLAVLAALGRESGIAFHVASAKQAGASREEVISAVLLGLPAAGQLVISALPTALRAYDET
jgi:alkylhydroperoxidase/carboxymuconolactone decarboxylase family protein YurZ